MSYTTVPAKSPGDVFSATPMWNTYLRDNLNKGVIRPIAETTLTVAAASIDFTSIAADWSHLLVELYLRGDAAATAPDWSVRFNGDTGANYDYDKQTINGGTVSAAGQAAAATSAIVGKMPGGSAAANSFLAAAMRINHYAGTADHKTASVEGSYLHTAAATGIVHLLGQGRWRSVAAINQITLIPASGNFAIGTRVTLYGMGGI